MPYVISRYNKLTTAITTTVNSASPTLVSPAVASEDTKRQGYNLCNNSATWTVYAYESNSDVAPAFSTTSGFHYKLAPGASVPSSAGAGVRLWLINDSSPDANTTVTYTEMT